MTRLVVAELSAHEALLREKAARQSSDALARQFQIMFDSVPGKFIVFAPISFDIIAVSDAFLAKTGTRRVDVVGRHLFDVLPRQPDDQTHAALRESFDRVLATGQSDLLDVQTFLCPKPKPAQGTELRYWALSNTPINGPDGRLLYIMLRLQDVTDAISPADDDPTGADSPIPEGARIDLVAHTHALRSDNLRLSQMAARLRTTQRLLDNGTFDTRGARAARVARTRVQRLKP